MFEDDLSLAMQAAHTLYSVGAAVKDGKVLIESDSGWRELTDAETADVATAVADMRYQIQVAKTKQECSERISTQWDQIGQINAIAGIYGEVDGAACVAWIDANRVALYELLARDDLLDIDVADDQYWPVYEGS
ncbi:hypothetical protein [Marinomonas transparens]|uniref:DUF4376 domain-containing protein n=1 Tax=Marinomonas transparens TaxID=2795388 RepID=A0A934N538_9GAMM|nr:hypothetical protein [Marinomonas transparens]MBJ7536636.1 hypothetical protein [Marinomonas transparens]